MDFDHRITALMQMPLMPQTWDSMLRECEAIELSNPYIPSGYLWVVEYKRYQVALVKGDVWQAMKHLKAAVSLVPYNDQLLDEYVRLCQRESSIDCLVLIIASKRNETQVLELAKHFDVLGIAYAIVTGTGTEILHPRVVQVEVPDNYENIGRKVIAAYTWVYENLSPNMAVLQISDTMRVENADQLLHALAQLKSKTAYVGVSVEAGLEHDRCRHWGRCEDPELNKKVYSRPYCGPWAEGDAYYLGAGVMGKLVLSMIRFPAQFDGEYYADKLVGDALMFEGYTLMPITNYAELGLACTVSSDGANILVDGSVTA